MKKTYTNPISDILPNLIRQKGWEIQLELYDIFRNWADLVGEEVAGCSRPLKVERNVLWVEVENSAWLQQMQYQKIWMLEELNNFLQLSRLSDLRLVIETKSQETPKKKSQKIKFVSPPSEEYEAFKKQTQWIEDEASRDALVNFWYLCHACKVEEGE